MFLYTQAELLASTPILTRTVDAANFKSFRTFAGVDNLLAYLKKELKVEVGKKDDLLTVAFDSPHPLEAAAVVNAVVGIVRRPDGEAEKVQRPRGAASAAAREGEARWGSATRPRQMLTFKEANGTLSFESEKGNVVTQQLVRLSDALTKRAA